ncbi:DNA primase [Mycoplasmoides alvi]|uniref:DNA primase n=1 Tax=Mycoplasmoides alvi TaxID=78580 RepID=UPI00051C4211|nr:DNA primase [Mycoplasmoides alvi]
MERNNIVNELKKKIDIVQVIGQYLNLQKKGNNFWAICPFHSDTRPSLSISPFKKLFNCFSCNTKGDVFNFIQLYKNISYDKALIEVCELVGINDENLIFFKKNNSYSEENQKYYQINNLALKFFQLSLANINAVEINNYLKKRKFKKELIEYFSIGCALDKNSDLCDALLESNNLGFNINMTDLKNIGLAVKDKEKTNFFINRIIFPIYDEYDNIVAFSGRSVIDDINIPKYKNTETTKIFKKDEILYNYNKINKINNLNSIYVCEGYMDVIALHSIGINNAVALMGLNLSDHHIKLIKKIKEIKEVIIALDNDKPGIEASISCAKKLISHGINVSLFKYPDNSSKDIDELVNKNELNQKNIIDLKIDYFEYLINLEKNKLSNNFSNNEIIYSVEKIFKEIKTFSNPILWDRYISLISNKFNLSTSNLKETFDKLIIKSAINSNYYQDNYENKTNKKNITNELIIKIKKNCIEYYESILNIETYLIVLFYYHKDALIDFNNLTNIKNTHNYFQKLCLRLTNYYKLNEKITFNSFLKLAEDVKNDDTSEDASSLYFKIVKNIKYENQISIYNYDDLKKEIIRLYQTINLFMLTKDYLKNIFLYLNDQQLFNNHLKNIKEINKKNQLFYEKIMKFKK